MAIIGLSDVPVQSSDITPFTMTECAEMTDGDCSGSAGCVSGFEYMIGIDLESPKLVNTLYIDISGGTGAYYITQSPSIRYSHDNSDWILVSNLSLSSNTEGVCSDRAILEFDDVEARYFRSWCTWRPYLNNITALPATSVFTGQFSGYTYEQGSPVSRTLYLYTRSDGTYVDATTSSGDGSYSFTTTNSGAHFIVCLDDEAGEDFNDLVFGNLIPATVSG